MESLLLLYQNLRLFNRKIYILPYPTYTMEKIKCNYCEKEIEGYTKKQVEYMLKQHILSKHPEKIKIEGGKK